MEPTFRPGPYRVESHLRQRTLYDAQGRPIAEGYATPFHEHQDDATFRLLASAHRTHEEGVRLVDYLIGLGMGRTPAVLAFARALEEPLSVPGESER